MPRSGSSHRPLARCRCTVDEPNHSDAPARYSAPSSSHREADSKIDGNSDHRAPHNLYAKSSLEFPSICESASPPHHHRPLARQTSFCPHGLTFLPRLACTSTSARLDAVVGQSQARWMVRMHRCIIQHEPNLAVRWRRSRPRHQL
jgi:hypothetical protein